MLRLRRSTMNVPANDFEKIKQAICSDVDVIMMDLEDFLVYKKRFVESLDEKKLRIYWNKTLSH